MLRRAQIGLREWVLEVGCGRGVVTEELVRRCPGVVVAVDRDVTPAIELGTKGAKLVEADALALPFTQRSFGLVFFQNVLLWVSDLTRTVSEAARVLGSGGCLVAIEPDFGGMIEYPQEIALRGVWLRALASAGADPEVGRKLPATCERTGLEVWVEFQAVPQPVTPLFLDLLEDIALEPDELARVQYVKEALAHCKKTWDAFVHVPYFLVVATKP